MLADPELGLFFIGVPEGEGKVVLEMQKTYLTPKNLELRCSEVQ